MDDSIEQLANATWQVLDDMGRDGLCCCKATKAQLRAAYEPFNDGEAEPEMTMKQAKEVLTDLS